MIYPTQNILFGLDLDKFMGYGFMPAPSYTQ